MLKYLAIGIISILSITPLFSQNPLLKEANLFFEARQYDKALNAYTVYNRNNPGNNQVLTNLGICNYHTGNSQKAIQSLNALLTSAKKPDADAFLYLAKSYHSDGQFKRASDTYKGYLSKIKLDNPMRKHIRDAIKRCGSGIRLKATKADAIVENIGSNINTSQDDYGAILSPTYSDRLYFSSVRPSNQGRTHMLKSQQDEKYSTNTSDVFSASIVNGSWDNVQPIGGGLNSAKDDQVLDFSSDGQSLVLWKSVNGYSGNVIVDTFSNDGTIRRGTFDAISGKQADGGLFFYNDTTVLFYSSREGGYGGSDIYASFYRPDGWSKAYNLGAQVNSAYDEISPILSADGSSLYYASNRPESIGGFDIFKSSFEVGKQEWSIPKNMGAPINSGRDDYQLRLDPRGLLGYMTSNRPGGHGQLDIYVIYFKNYLDEQQTGNVISSLSHLSKSKVVSATSESETISYDESQIKKYTIRPIYYDNDDRIITPDNLASLDEAVKILKDNSNVTIEIIGGSDKSASLEFDLYFSIKRAEEVANYFAQKGIQKNRIISRGSGQSYPIIRHEINGQPVLLSKKINRRVEFIFKNTEGLPIEIIKEKPASKNPSFEMPGIQRLLVQSSGISYRVAIATTSNMYNGNIIGNYPDPMIDKPMDRNLYRYTIGMYGTYKSAQFMKFDLIKQGVVGASVIPFINGKELNKETGLQYVDSHPDIVNYLVNE